MKKVILAVILIAALGCGIFFGYTAYTKAPENAIVGTWNNDKTEGLYYEFHKDGTMSGKATISSLSTTAAIDGTYTIDKDTSTLNINYQLSSSLLPIRSDYSISKTFEFTKDGKLILTDESGNATTFTKAEK